MPLNRAPFVTRLVVSRGAVAFEAFRTTHQARAGAAALLRDVLPTPERAEQIRAAIAERKARNKAARWNPPPRGVPKDFLPVDWPSIHFIVGRYVAQLSERERVIVYAAIGKHRGVSGAALGRFLGGLSVGKVWQAAISATRKKYVHLVPMIEKIKEELPT